MPYNHPITAEQWNEVYPIGTRVRYRSVLGDPNYKDSRTRGLAWTLGDGSPVVAIEGVSGGVALWALQVLLD